MTDKIYVSENPQLIAEWDYEKNIASGLDASKITCGSHKKAWWKCQHGHTWEAIISNRAKGVGCPICVGKMVLAGFNDLSTIAPQLAKEWHPTKNGDLSPSQITAGSGKAVWWMDELGHEWQASPCSRARGTGCPICSGKQVLIGFNDLSTTNPDLVSEWDYEKNAFFPTEVSQGSNKTVWWKCKYGHSWTTTITSRTNKKLGCPVCSGKRSLAGYNDLATTHPQLIKEWHPTKNGTLLPTQVTFGSDKNVWWMCGYGHEWQSPVQRRTRGSGCPTCAKGLRVSFPEKAVFFYLKKVFPDAIENYHVEWLGKSEIDIFVPSIATGIEYDGRQFHKDISADKAKNLLCESHGLKLIRIREAGCPSLPHEFKSYYLKNRSQQELEYAIEYLFNDLGIIAREFSIDIEADKAAIYEYIGFTHKDRSLLIVAPNLTEEWHPTKNGVLASDMVTPYSDRYVWWFGKCGHEWKDSVSHRYSGRTCPICSGRKVLSGFNDLQTTHPDIAKEWHSTKNGTLMPDQVSKGSNRKVWWQCQHGHEWQAVIATRTNGVGCPICLGRVPLKGSNDLETLYPDIAKQWSTRKNERLKPSEVVPGSAKKVWWSCPKCGHEYQKTVRQKIKVPLCPKCHQ